MIKRLFSGLGLSVSLLASTLIAASPAQAASEYYFYADAVQQYATTSLTASMTIGHPTLAADGYHSLAELAVQSADKNQVIEVGWTVDPTTFGDSNTHLFVYHWVNGQSTCYGCGFVDNTANPVNAGASLSAAVGTAKVFGINYVSGAWWISYDGAYVGNFPGLLWSGATPPATFVTSGYIRAFGEVAASTTTPCTDMGSGSLGQSGQTPAATKISSVTFDNGAGSVALQLQSTPQPTWYKSTMLAGSTRSFYFGGPGAC